MSNIAPSGTLINLWCIVRENRSIFKITIGAGNDLFDLRKVIKEERKPRFDDFAPDELILWRINIASSVLRNKETAIEPYLNEKLEDPADTVGNTFQNVEGRNIRVVVDVSVTEQLVAALSSNKRQHEDHIVTTEGPLHSHQGSLMLPIHEREIFQVVKPGFLRGKSFIIHGPYQSGKST